MPALDAYCEERLRALEATAQRREMHELLRHDEVYVKHEDKDYISFSCNDYFGLSQSPEMRQAVADATLQYGAGAGASRLVTGNHPFYAQLESALAQHKRKESALVFGSGYLANIGVITALIGPEDLIVADKLIHACMLDGIKLSGAKMVRFAHNDLAHAEQLLKRHRSEYRHAWILTETIFSMDGDRAPLKALREVADRHDAMMLVDDAHGFGFEDTHCQLADVVVGTLSKGLGGYGGYAACSKTVRDALINFGRSFIFTTGLSIPDIAISINSLNLINSNNQIERLLKNVEYFCTEMGCANPESPIIAWPVGEAEDAVKLQQVLREHGVWVQAIRPPTVPPGTSRLRIAFSALHTKEQIDQLVGLLKQYG